MFALKAVLIVVLFTCIAHNQALNSLHNYGNSVYPGRCVIDLGSSVVLMNFGESVKLDQLPCTQIFCIGNGWGMLQTCDYKRSSVDCRLGHFTDWDADYPKCCKRQIACV